VRLDTSSVVDSSTSYVTISLEGQCVIEGHEVVEAINVLHGGDLRLARISEFGFFTGEDRVVNGLDNEGTSFDYTEAIYTQLAVHRCTTGTDISDPTTTVVEKLIYESADTFLLD